MYVITFVSLVIFSAFFSSAETSLLSLNSIRLKHRAEKKNKKAKLLLRILRNPEEFFSTILIGNNIVNIVAASISTIFFTRIFYHKEELILLSSTIFTTFVILLFAEIIPKSYAFRYSEKLAFHYASPIRFFSCFFYPFVKIFSFLSNLFLKNANGKKGRKDITSEELKHFLSTEVALFKYNPDSLKMLNEIIDVWDRDIKSLMTPRMEIIAIDVDSSPDQFENSFINGGVSRFPLFRNNLDNIEGILNLKKVLPSLIRDGIKKDVLLKSAEKPFFITEFSSLNYVLKEFKENGQEIAIVLDEYGITIGVLTLNDIFGEILGEIDLEAEEIMESGKGVFVIKGSVPVEEVNSKLNIELPQRKDYSTFSGLFIFYFGKLPKRGDKININGFDMIVKKMGKWKIAEIKLILFRDTE